jgi:hypothetical protein
METSSHLHAPADLLPVIRIHDKCWITGVISPTADLDVVVGKKYLLPLSGIELLFPRLSNCILVGFS